MEIANQLYGGTLLLGLITYLGYQLREIPKLIWGQIKNKLLYTAHIEETSELFF